MWLLTFDIQNTIFLLLFKVMMYSTSNNKRGRKNETETVMCLTHVRRQQGFFKDFLLRVRDGLSTEVDWHRLNSECTTDSMSQDRIRSFEERQAGLTYVNLSRLTEWSNLCIGKAIPLDRLTTKISSCKRMEKRIAEDSRLRGLWDSTKAFYNLSR